MFGEEADDLGGGVEKKVRDLADKRAKLSSDFFEAAGHCFSGRFQSFGYRADNRPNRTPAARRIAVTVTPFFF